MVYENVCNLAKEKGLSITKLEELAGLPNGIIGKWNPEREKPFEPSFGSLRKLSKTLDVSIDELVKE